MNDDGYLLLAIADDFRAQMNDGELLDPDDVYDWLVTQAHEVGTDPPQPDPDTQPAEDPEPDDTETAPPVDEEEPEVDEPDIPEPAEPDPPDVEDLIDDLLDGGL